MSFKSLLEISIGMESVQTVLESNVISIRDQSQQVSHVFFGSEKSSRKRSQLIHQYFTTITQTKKDIVGYLLQLANSHVRLFPSQQHMGRRIGRTRETVNGAIGELVRDGVLKKIKRRYASNMYVINSLLFFKEIREKLIEFFSACRYYPYAQKVGKNGFFRMSWKAAAIRGIEKNFTLYKNRDNKKKKNLSNLREKKQLATSADNYQAHNFKKGNVMSYNSPEKPTPRSRYCSIRSTTEANKRFKSQNPYAQTFQDAQLDTTSETEKLQNLAQNNSFMNFMTSVLGKGAQELLQKTQMRYTKKEEPKGE